MMSIDDLLIREAATGSIRYSDALKAYLRNGELLPVYEAQQVNDLVLADKLVIEQDGRVMPIGVWQVRR
jgi:hypothetical protein